MKNRVFFKFQLYYLLSTKFINTSDPILRLGLSDGGRCLHGLCEVLHVELRLRYIAERCLYLLQQFLSRVHDGLQPFGGLLVFRLQNPEALQLKTLHLEQLV